MRIVGLGVEDGNEGRTHASTFVRKMTKYGVHRVEEYVE